MAAVGTDLAGPMVVQNANLLAVGTLDGNVASINPATGQPMATTNLGATGIAAVRLIDMDGNSTPQLLVDHGRSIGLPAYLLDPANMTEVWHTNTPISQEWNAGPEGKLWAGDFNGDGELEFVLPYHNNDQGTGYCLKIVSGADGSVLATIPQTSAGSFSVYQDPQDGAYHLVTVSAPNGSTHYCQNYLLGVSPTLQSTNSSVNTEWLGSVSSTTTDGKPRIWGGWYGRTLYMLNGDGSTAWSKRFGGSYEAQAMYVDNLLGDGQEGMIVGGCVGQYGVRLDAVKMSDGSSLWQTPFVDNDGWWAIVPFAAVDVNGDGAKDIIAGTQPDTANGFRRKYEVIDGRTGAKLWETAYNLDPNGKSLYDCRFTDLNHDGQLDVLLAVNNTIEVHNAATGQLITTYAFASDVTAFDIGVSNEVTTSITGVQSEYKEGDTPSLDIKTTGPVADSTWFVYDKNGDLVAQGHGTQFAPTLPDDGPCDVINTVVSDPPVALDPSRHIPGQVASNGRSGVAGIALSPDESTLYLSYDTGSAADAIGTYILSTRSNGPAVGAYGQGHGSVVTSPDGRYVYTVNYYEGEVTRFDTANGDASQSIAVGPWARSLKITPDGSRLVAFYNYADDQAATTVAVIDVANDAFQLQGHLDLGLNALGAVFSADGLLAYVPGSRVGTSQSSVLAIDLQSLTITGSAAMSDVRFTAQPVLVDGKLYVGSGDAGTIYVLDPATLQPAGDPIALDFAPRLLAMHPDGIHLFVAGSVASSRISVVDLTTGHVVGSLDDMPGVSDIVFPSDGTTAYVARSGYMNGEHLGGITVVDIRMLAGSYASDSCTITVTNVAPTITPVSSDALTVGSKAEKSTVTISGNFTDPGIADTHTAMVDWGDGQQSAGTVSETDGSGSITASHSYAQGGVYKVSVTLVDKDGGSASADTSAVVTGAGVQDGVLWIVGTQLRDQVTVSRRGDGAYSVLANFFSGINPRAYPSAGISRIEILLGAGNDTATILPSVTATAVIDSGAGNDVLCAGGGPSVLLGGPGSDQLFGGVGRCICIGGTGIDWIQGGPRDDILVPGTTNIDGSVPLMPTWDAALLTLMGEWNSARSYQERVSRSRGLFHANDDGARDYLLGQLGMDWFFARLSGDLARRDVVQDRHINELLDRLA